MLLVGADTGPIRYLVEIGHIEILPQLFERIYIPAVVYDEMRHPSAPAVVRNWLSRAPEWMVVMPVTVPDDPALQSLDDGEKSALTLGIALGGGPHLDRRPQRRSGGVAKRISDGWDPRPPYSGGSTWTGRPWRCSGEAQRD